MLERTEQRILLDLAWQSIQEGLATGRPLIVRVADFPATLQRPGASFVTLHRRGELRGCIGSLKTQQPLVRNVVDNAFNAAFRDPRFPPLEEPELVDLELEISVLGDPTGLSFASESDLLGQLEPGRDGLILEVDGHQATFLPSVWESLPEPRGFLEHLKLKAGLTAGYWSENLRVQRYRTQSFQRLADGRSPPLSPAGQRRAASD
jgi:AmmeMemoRadiSam system protein A